MADAKKPYTMTMSSYPESHSQERLGTILANGSNQSVYPTRPRLHLRGASSCVDRPHNNKMLVRLVMWRQECRRSLRSALGSACSRSAGTTPLAGPRGPSCTRSSSSKANGECPPSSRARSSQPSRDVPVSKGRARTLSTGNPEGNTGTSASAKLKYRVGCASRGGSLSVLAPTLNTCHRSAGNP